MKTSTKWLIFAGVALAHVVLFCLVAGISPLPKVPYIPPDNFSLGWAKFKDPATHENMVYQEFTVTTHLAKPAASPAPR